jgi:hypothetical protein
MLGNAARFVHNANLYWGQPKPLDADRRARESATFRPESWIRGDFD